MFSATEQDLLQRLGAEIAQTCVLQRKQAGALASTAERLSKVDHRLGLLELHLQEKAFSVGLAQSASQFGSLAKQIELSTGGQPPPPVPWIRGDAGKSMPPAEQGVLHVGEASQAIYLPLACLADPYFDASRQRGSGGGGSGGGE
mmetsp:Transcript_17919/g.57739  ORF Transcript_17919/g.57739 Transcript_17919/m.57739 type:complete len:145 (-) Transcript_17919:5-439(-)